MTLTATDYLAVIGHGLLGALAALLIASGIFGVLWALERGREK